MHLKGWAEEKVPGGKLVRIKVDYDSVVNDVKITGDFFLHPEEGLAEIEGCLRGIDVNAEQDAIAERIRQVVSSRGMTLIGLNEDALARILKEAMK